MAFRQGYVTQFYRQVLLKTDFALKKRLWHMDTHLPLSATSLINLDRYPIHKMGVERDVLINQVRASLAEDGCAVLRQFLTSEGIAQITAEADSVAANAHRSFGRTNPYFTEDDETL